MTKRILICLTLKWSPVLFLLLTFFESPSQITDPQKFVQSYPKTEKGLDELLTLSRANLYTDRQASRNYAMQVYQLARAQKDTARLMRACQYLGVVLRQLGKGDSAMIVLEQLRIMAEARRDTTKLISALNLSGSALLTQSKYDLALKSHIQSMTLAEKIHDFEDVASNLNNIGMVYHKLKDYTKAVAYFKRCLRLDILRDNIEFQHQLHLNISVGQAYVANYREALAHIDTVLRQCPDKCSLATLMMADFNLGVVYFSQREYDRAEDFFFQSHERAKDIKDARFQFDNLIYLAEIGIRTNQPMEAIKILKRSERLLRNGTDLALEKIKIYNEFYRAYALLNDVENTVRYQRRYINLKDSIYNESLINNLMKVEAEYVEKGNLAKIRAQTEVLALRQEVIDRQRWINILSVLVIVSLFLFLFQLFQRYTRKRLINEKLELRVRERTKELETKHLELIRACGERDLLIDHVAFDLVETLATINGLCNLGRKERDRNLSSLNGFQKLSENLGSTITTLKDRSRP